MTDNGSPVESNEKESYCVVGFVFGYRLYSRDIDRVGEERALVASSEMSTMYDIAAAKHKQNSLNIMSTGGEPSAFTANDATTIKQRAGTTNEQRMGVYQIKALRIVLDYPAKSKWKKITIRCSRYSFKYVCPLRIDVEGG